MRDFQILGGPGWLESTQYDIAAKVGSSLETNRSPEKSLDALTDDKRQTKDDYVLFSQSWLTDRFQPRVHGETKELPVFALEVNKGGPKLQSNKLRKFHQD